MAKLSFAQIEQLWTDNGGNPQMAPLMAAIAMAESGGNTEALNDNPHTGDYSVGLWQINYFGGMRGPRTKEYGSPEALKASPAAQVKAAAALLGDGSGITNWQGDAAYKAWQQGEPLTAFGAPPGTLIPSVEQVTGGTTANGSVSTLDTQPQPTPEQRQQTATAEDTGDIDGFLQSQAPELAKALGSDPQVASLLQQWGSNQLSDQEFQNDLEATDWWKNTPQTQRTLLATQATDPATAQQNIANQAASVWNAANQMGVALNAGQVTAIANASIKNGWSSQQIQDNIATHYATGGKDIGGQASIDAQQIRSLYAAYALPPGDDASIQRQVQQLLSTGRSASDFASELASQAKSLYGNNPDIAAALDRGETMQQAMTSYANVASARLGIDPNTIDWAQPKWNKALTGTTDPASGRTTPMSLSQWQTTLMTNPIYGWADSPDGKQQATAGALTLAQSFGEGTP